MIEGVGIDPPVGLKSDEKKTGAVIRITRWIVGAGETLVKESFSNEGRVRNPGDRLKTKIRPDSGKIAGEIPLVGCGQRRTGGLRVET